jgi:hypothetical protein
MEAHLTEFQSQATLAEAEIPDTSDFDAAPDIQDIDL